MKNTLWISVLILAVAGQAQEVKERKQVQVFTRAVGGPVPDHLTTAPFHFMAAEFDEEAVKGLPYSAEAVNEQTQTLADGNRISRKNSTQIYRDGEGRTRREETINAIGPWASGTPQKMIFINDPVAKVNWVIDPQRKEARKMTRSVTIEDGAIGKKIEWAGAEQGKLRIESEDVTVGVAGTMVAGAAPAQRIRIARGTGPAVMFLGENSEGTSESLGKRMIEGVEAEGTKSTHTIAAGEIGNDRPIVTESERWFSPELKVTVMTRHSDPRVGENTYKLTNIRRGEPTPALFQPPSDYTVIEAGSQVIHMKRSVEK